MRNGLVVVNDAGHPPTHSWGGNIDITLASVEIARGITEYRVHEERRVNDHRLINVVIDRRVGSWRWK